MRKTIIQIEITKRDPNTRARILNNLPSPDPLYRASFAPLSLTVERDTD